MFRYIFLFLLVVVSFSVNAQLLEERALGAANVGFSVNSIGLVGNAFKGIYRTGSGSAEWPKGSKIEHMFQGGLWVGGLINNVAYVSSGYIDEPTGYSCGAPSFDFTPKSQGFKLRSSLPTSPNYDPINAVSHEDLLATFTDANLFCLGADGQPTGQPVGSGHRPMGIEVDVEFYNWSFSYADYFVIGVYRVRNVGNNTIDSVYLGMLTNGVVRNTNVTGAGSGGANYFNKGGNGYLKDVYTGYDFDVNGDPNETGSYFAQKYLGSKDKTGDKVVVDTGANRFKVLYSTWIFQSSSGSLCYQFPGKGGSSDVAQYERLKKALSENPCWDSLPGTGDCGCAGDPKTRTETIRQEIAKAGNRSNFLSAGPYATLAPGDTIEFTMAFYFAKQTNLPPSPRSSNPDNDSTRIELKQKAEALQIIYDNDFLLPEPPPVPFVFYKPENGKITIEWADNAEKVPDPQTNEFDFEGYRVYRTAIGFDVSGISETQEANSNLKLVHTVDTKDNQIFFDNGFESVLHPKPYDTIIKVGGKDSTVRVKYRYVMDNLNNGWQYGVAITSFDRGNENIASLESATSQSVKLLFPGTSVNGDVKKNEPYVYPNPYYSGASWEGKSIFEEDRRINFANLPDNCVVKIFSPNGDVIHEFSHSRNYGGEGSQWYKLYSDPKNAQFTGGEHSWNLLSTSNQIISRGLYVYTIEKQDQIVYKGTFAVIK